ncbi:oligosaccharide flippase family protein [Saccharococcus caldoxylosilyticus]|uniref:Uncharacterized protein n=1 Tax=Saccharococcus caldoxylosilyticus TaxID=81408 RepID=A0A150M3Y9_9BACL|nr:oligosaccharide flippase family protein [Parageobacillus caldoxylosilyticus]KYD19071.1 hypothetical protein B4119_3901 [Parageobacillus caldoxylosilyticus]
MYLKKYKYGILNFKLIFSSIITKGIKAGFFHLLFANILLQIAGFGGQIFLTRILPVEDIGRIRVLQSFLSIFLMLATLGINTTILKLCSTDNDETEKLKIFKNSIIISLFTSFGVVIVVWFLSFNDLLSKDQIINQQMSLFILQVPIMVLNSIVLSYLQAQQKIKEISNIQSISKLFIIVISIISAFIYNLNGYILGLLIATFLSSFIYFLPLKKTLKRLKYVKINVNHTKHILKFSSYTFGIGLLWQIIISSGSIVSSSFFNEDNVQLAYYGTAQLIINTLMMIPMTLNQIMIPRLSRQEKDMFILRKTFENYQKRMIVLITMVTIASYIIIPYLIPIVFGQSYNGAIGYFKILLIGFLCWGIYSPKNNLLFSIGKVKYVFYANLLACVINFFLNIILINQYGVLGIGYSSCVTFFLSILINNYYFKKFIK